MAPTQSVRWTLVDYHLALTIPLAVFTHLYYAPYTKVEESFNVQALHDWLFLGVRQLDKWDHITFPGAVPRSFIPSLLLAVSSYPVLLMAKMLGYIHDSTDVQFILRGVLGLLWSAACLFFVHATSKGAAKYTSSSTRVVRRTLILFMATHFHLPFWSTRTTPNGLAFPGVLVSLALILPRGLTNERKHMVGISLLTFLAVVYRLELIVLLGASGLYLVHSRFTAYRSEFDPHPVESVGKLAGTVQATLTLSGATSVLLDSYLWRAQDTWIIPEVEGVKFNVLEGKSSEWGVSPWHYYLTSSLPKMLAGVTPFVVLGVGFAFHSIVASRRRNAAPARKDIVPRNKRNIDEELASRQSDTIPTFALLFIPLVHISALSYLAHKEWRFISYVVPLLNLLAATVVGSLASLAASTVKRYALYASLLLTIALNSLLSIVSLTASHLNYPGGEALRDLHRNGDAHVNVHIATLPAMTGVTLFQSKYIARRKGAFGFELLPSVLPPTSPLHPTWTYDKTEGIAPDDVPAWQQYTHLLSDVVECPADFTPMQQPHREFERLRVSVEPVGTAASATRLLGVPGLASLSLDSNTHSPSLHVDILNRRRLSLTWRTKEAVTVCRRRV